MRNLVFWGLMAVSPVGFSEEIHVLSGGAARAFIEPASASFKGHTVRLEYQTMGRLQKTVASPEGAKYDVLVVTDDVARKLGLKAVPLARTGMGVAVREGAPVPDVSTPEALKRALLAARSVAQINPATGTSGKYVVQIFEKLGIAEAMKPKVRYVDEGPAAALVASGETELAIHQMSEIVPLKGVKLAGPVPESLQTYTVYNGAPAPGTKKGEAVAQYLRHLTSPEVRSTLAAAGYTEPR
jgi:molybdate transport system substrate-binding protein